MDRTPQDLMRTEPAPYQLEALELEKSELVREGWPEALERREGRRRASGLPVQILWQGQRIPASLENLCRAGLGLRTDAKLSLGAHIRVELEGNASLVWSGTVVHRREVARSLSGAGAGWVGLELREISPALELLLQD